MTSESCDVDMLAVVLLEYQHLYLTENIHVSLTKMCMPAGIGELRRRGLTRISKLVVPGSACLSLSLQLLAFSNGLQLRQGTPP